MLVWFAREPGILGIVEDDQRSKPPVCSQNPIAADSDLRIRTPKNFLRQTIDETRTVEARLKPSLDPRLPLPGTPLIRRYQGTDIIVHVRADGGFECDGRIHKSLSKAVTDAT